MEALLFRKKHVNCRNPYCYNVFKQFDYDVIRVVPTLGLFVGGHIFEYSFISVGFPPSGLELTPGCFDDCSRHVLSHKCWWAKNRECSKMNACFVCKRPHFICYC